MDKKERLKGLLKNVDAVIAAMRVSLTSAQGEAANIGNYTSYKSFMQKYEALAREALPLLPENKLLTSYDLSKVKGSGETVWPVQKEYCDSTFTNLSLLKSLIENEIGFADDETENLKAFLESKLRKAIFAVPEKESEVQQAIETLLVGRGMTKGADYDRETGRVKVSGREFIPDFIFRKLGLCMEVKLCNSKEKLKDIVEETNADIRAYGSQYPRQLYVIYDVGIIQHEDEFRRGIQDTPGVSVVVVKH